MNLTNAIDLKIRKIFEGVILTNSHENYLNIIINKNIDTYYEEPQNIQQTYFSFVDTGSVESFADYLNEFWMEKGFEGFVSMVDEMSELAFLLCSDSDTQSEDVSQFIYTMY